MLLQDLLCSNYKRVMQHNSSMWCHGRFFSSRLTSRRYADIIRMTTITTGKQQRVKAEEHSMESFICICKFSEIINTRHIHWDIKSIILQLHLLTSVRVRRHHTRFASASSNSYSTLENCPKLQGNFTGMNRQLGDPGPMLFTFCNTSL